MSKNKVIDNSKQVMDEITRKNFAFLVLKYPLSVLCIMRGFFQHSMLHLYRGRMWGIYSTDHTAETDISQEAVSMRKNKAIDIPRQVMDEITRKKYCFFG